MCAVRVEHRPEVSGVEGSYEKPARTWAGHGKGTSCDHCHQPIETDQVEYEIELAVDRHPRIVTVHLACYDQWILLQRPRPERFCAAADKTP